MFNPYFHTVPLFDYTSAYPQLNGTGVFIAVDEHRFVVTAAHVVEASAENVAFGRENEVDGKMVVELFGHEKLPICKAQAQTGEGEPQLATYKDGLDLALIHLPLPFRNWLEERYQPFDLRKNNPPDGTGIVSVTGWPERKNRYNYYRKEFEGSQRCYHLQSQAVNRQLVKTIGGDPEIDIAIRMDKKKDFFSIITMQHYTVFKLYGMSGCGVWNVDYTPGAPAFPENAVSLAGIFVEDHKDKKLAKVIRARYLWDILCACCGILRHP